MGVSSGDVSRLESLRRPSRIRPLTVPSGCRTLIWAFARAARPGLPVVFISGHEGARHPSEGVAGSAFIAKPCRGEQIVEALGGERMDACPVEHAVLVRNQVAVNLDALTEIETQSGQILQTQIVIEINVLS